MLDYLSGWVELLAAGAAFLIAHALPARPALRSQLIAVAGRRMYLFAYSIASLLLLGWLIQSAARAPFVELWPYEDWQLLVPAVGMLFGCVLLTFGLTSPNPLSIGGRHNARFDPQHPGIAGVVRHPILWATLVWSVSHAVPNGDISHVLMFGTFALFSAIGMIAIDRRRRSALGEAEWRTMAQFTSNLPFAGIARGWRVNDGAGTALRLAGGVVLYLLLILLHGAVTGVPLLG
jgi:uncharacterized membrane protein